jgi:hypothetical protein
MNDILHRILVFSVSVLSGFPLLNAQDVIKNNTFREGENITYDISYNWGPIWVDAGRVTFSVSRENFIGKEAYHLKSTGKTFPSYDLLFKVRDYYDSWIDPLTFKSFEFRRNIYEGGYTLINTLRFDHQNNRILSNTKTNNNPLRTDTLKMMHAVYDMLSAVYYTRTLDFSNLKPDERIPVWVAIDDAFYAIYIRSLGKEVAESKDGTRYRCIKFAAKMVQGTIFRGEEDVLVWVTDDENKVPVYIEAKIIVGTVKAYLKDAKGLKNPVTSLVR